MRAQPGGYHCDDCVECIEEDTFLNRIDVAQPLTSQNYALSICQSRELSKRDNRHWYSGDSTGVGADIFILDTGVDKVHQEFLLPLGITRVKRMSGISGLEVYGKDRKSVV